MPTSKPRKLSTQVTTGLAKRTRSAPSMAKSVQKVKEEVWGSSAGIEAGVRILRSWNRFEARGLHIRNCKAGCRSGQIPGDCRD